MARLSASDVGRLKLKWAFGFFGTNRSVAQPTVIAGRVFIGSSQNGKVYSLDAKSGCTYWQYTASRPVRSTIVVGPLGDGWAAYFGDQGANVHAIDALADDPKSRSGPLACGQFSFSGETQATLYASLEVI
jgi:polyvinyl alcohol dehydrogenase (cytochrome)